MTTINIDNTPASEGWTEGSNPKPVAPKTKPPKRGGTSGKADYGQIGTVQAYAFDPDDLVIVDEDPEHPLYDPERAALPLDEALVLSIMHRGVLEPIEFSKNPETGKCEVVDGKQRTKCAREANKRLKKQGMPPVIVTGIPRRTRDAVELSGMMAATFIRQEEGPLSKAKRAQRMLDRGAPEESVCLDMGISAGTLRNYLALLEAPAVVRKAVEAGKVPASLAYQLKSATAEEAAAKVEEIAATRQLGSSGKRAKRGTGAKAQAIVSDGKGKTRNRSSGAKCRPGVEVKAMHRQIANAKMTAERREGALAAIEWVLGGKLEKTLGEISDLSDETEE